MPTYLFQSSDGDTISVSMDMKQPIDAYHTQVRDGKTYKRVYENPHMAVDSLLGTDAKDFHRGTTNKKGLTIGQMQDLSKEMSVKRAEKEGIDQKKELYYKQYETLMGTKHADILKREKNAAKQTRLAKAKKKLKKYGVQVEL